MIDHLTKGCSSLSDFVCTVINIVILNTAKIVPFTNYLMAGGHISTDISELTIF